MLRSALPLLCVFAGCWLVPACGDDTHPTIDLPEEARGNVVRGGAGGSHSARADCDGARTGTPCGPSMHCVFDACVRNACGDGWPAYGEACDDGNERDGDGCSARCEMEAPPGCGNGVLEPGEDCDDGNTKAADGCEPDCTLITEAAGTGGPDTVAPADPAVRVPAVQLAVTRAAVAVVVRRAAVAAAVRRAAAAAAGRRVAAEPAVQRARRPAAAVRLARRPAAAVQLAAAAAAAVPARVARAVVAASRARRAASCVARTTRTSTGSRAASIPAPSATRRARP